MDKVTEDTIQRMVDEIVREAQPEMVYVFGSYGRGDANQESDIDLLIVENAEFSPSHSRWTEIKRIRRALSKFQVSKDILVFSKSEFEYWKDARSHVVSQAARDGRLAYARP
jgi:uncharacterized protein